MQIAERKIIPVPGNSKYKGPEHVQILEVQHIDYLDVYSMYTWKEYIFYIVINKCQKDYVG